MILLLAACAPGSVDVIDRGRDTGIETIASPDPDTETDPPEPEVDLFSIDRLHSVDITLTPESIDSLGGEPYAYAPGDVVVDGVELTGVGVRLRGKFGAFRTLDGKPKLKIDFNQYSDQRLGGVETLSLSNAVVDCSYLKESLAYEVFRQAGVPASRTSFAQVTVNGADYGLYVLIETPDDRFLERNYEDPSGNLYDGKYILYDDGNYQLLDFGIGVDTLFQLEEGEDVDHADITAISDAYLATVGRPEFTASVGALVDWEEFHRLTAAEQWSGHVDGYAGNRNNYRVYFDPADGKADFLTWDLDYSFIDAGDWGLSWEYAQGLLANVCYTTADCRAAHIEGVEDVVDRVDTDALLALLDTLDTLTFDAAVADPRRECEQRGIKKGRDDLRSWIENRDASVAAYWGL